MERRQAPRVLLLDIDGTVIGRIAAAICEQTVLVLNTLDGKVGVSPATRRSALQAAERAMRASLVGRLRHGIIRPGFDDFCRRAQDPKQNLELFVYTAGDDRWAPFIVSCIETAVGIKFNRPLFTRRHCVAVADAPLRPPLAALRKSLSRVLPSVLATLRRKGHIIPDAAALRARVGLVDNTHTVGLHPSDTARLIRCSSYTFAYNYDVLGRADVEFLHSRYALLVPVLQRYDMFPKALTTAPDRLRFQRFSQLYHARLARALGETDALNSAALRDTFWARLSSAVFAEGGGGLDVDAINASVRE